MAITPRVPFNNVSFTRYVIPFSSTLSGIVVCVSSPVDRIASQTAVLTYPSAFYNWIRKGGESKISVVYCMAMVTAP